jgi:hypothetical protein
MFDARMSFRRSPADAAQSGSLPTEIPDDPVAFGAYRPDRSAIRNLGRALADQSTAKCTPILVGNDPLISWLVSDLSREPLAVGHSELVCLESNPRGRGWHVIWTIDPHGDEGYDPLVGKIESKMNSAKALGAVITGLLIFLIQNVIREQPVWLDWLTLLVLATSAGLYFAALFLDDGLLMPPRFWPAGQQSTARAGVVERFGARVLHGRTGLARPPSAASRVMQQAMVRIWNRVFIPATLMLGAATATLTVGATKHAEQSFIPDARAYVAALAWLLIVVAWVSANRPRLGVSD